VVLHNENVEQSIIVEIEVRLKVYTYTIYFNLIQHIEMYAILKHF